LRECKSGQAGDEIGEKRPQLRRGEAPGNRRIIGDRDLGEDPRELSGRQASVFLPGQLYRTFRTVASAFQGKHVDEVARLRARQESAQLVG
jgi:hypothetical protein